MKFRNTAIVLIVLAALAGYVYYAELSPSATPTPTAEIKLLDLNPDEVTGLQIGDAISRTVARKDNNIWQMDEPTKEEADSTRLNNLVAQFAKLKATRALTETPTNLAPFGLLTGTLTLTLQLKDNRSEVIRFGQSTLSGATVYTQRAGDPKVYLVSTTALADASRLLSAPPKKPTPTPTATPVPPTNTPAPTPLTTETPAPTGTPKP